MIGQKFNRLTIIGGPYHDKHYHKIVDVKCDCGNEKSTPLNALKSGKTKSCGCLNRESAKARATKHGKASHPLYSKWLGIKKRCYSQSDKAFCDYGARGIRMCDEWVIDFQQFYSWAISNGYSRDLEIDRIDNNGDYSPENCRFVSRKVNANNKRSNRPILYNGMIKNMTQWANELGIPYDVLRYRINAGWPIDKAFQIGANG